MLRLTISVPDGVEAASLTTEQIDAILSSRPIARQIQERASRIHALNVVLARHWWREGWHGGFW